MHQNSDEINNYIKNEGQNSKMYLPDPNPSANKENQSKILGESNKPVSSKRQVSFNSMIDILAKNVKEGANNLVINGKEDNFVNLRSNYLANYFYPSSNKYLHFFDEKSKSLFVKLIDPIDFLDIPWKKLSIPNSHKILTGHVSLSTPNGDLYMIGGITKEARPSNSFSKYNWVSHSLEELNHMITPRCNPSSIWLENCIYTFGGSNEHGPLNKCEKYLFSRKEWVEIAPMMFDIERPSVCVVNEKTIAVFHSRSQRENFVQLYDPLKDTWTLVSMDLSPNNIPLSFSLGTLVYQICENGFFYLQLGPDGESKKFSK